MNIIQMIFAQFQRLFDILGAMTSLLPHKPFWHPLLKPSSTMLKRLYLYYSSLLLLRELSKEF